VHNVDPRGDVKEASNRDSLAGHPLEKGTGETRALSKENRGLRGCGGRGARCLQRNIPHKTGRAKVKIFPSGRGQIGAWGIDSEGCNRRSGGRGEKEKTVAHEYKIWTKGREKQKGETLAQGRINLSESYIGKGRLERPGNSKLRRPASGG